MLDRLKALLLVPLVLLPLEGYAEDRALVIGIDKYPFVTVEGNAGAANLRGAVTDATKFHEQSILQYTSF